jgi:hypothetical protein
VHACQAFSVLRKRRSLNHQVAAFNQSQTQVACQVSMFEVGFAVRGRASVAPRGCPPGWQRMPSISGKVVAARR